MEVFIAVTVYLIGLAISYMIMMLETEQRPSYWGVSEHILCFVWPLVLLSAIVVGVVIGIPYLIIMGISKPIIYAMNKLYDFIEGGHDAIR